MTPLNISERLFCSDLQHFNKLRDMYLQYRVGNEPSDHEHYCERAEHYERMSEQRPSPAHERRAKALLRSPSTEWRIGLLSSLVITIAYVVRDGSRIDCVIFYDGLSSLFKVAVYCLTCDLTCSFPYSLSSSLPSSLPTRPANEPSKPRFGAARTRLGV